MKIWNKCCTLLVRYKFIFLLSSFFAFAFVFGLLMVYRGYMNYQGYCWKEQRYLTGQEKMKRAVSELLVNYPPAFIPKQDMEDKSGVTVEYIIPFEEFKGGVEFRGWSLSRPDTPILYGSVAGFLRKILIAANCGVIQILMVLLNLKFLHFTIWFLIKNQNM